MAFPNPLIAQGLVAAIDDTAASPTIQWGGSRANPTGTGIYGDIANVKMCIGGVDILEASASGVEIPDLILENLTVDALVVNDSLEVDDVLTADVSGIQSVVPLAITISSALCLSVTTAGVALASDVVIMSGTAAPTDVSTGANYAGPGSLYIRRSGADSNIYINVNTKASPTWKLVTRAA